MRLSFTNILENRWFAIVGRALLLTGFGVVGLTFIVNPMYQGANEPRPPLQASGDLVGVSLAESAGAMPSTWVTLEASAPTEESTSQLQITLQFDDSSELSSATGTIFIQGRLAAAFTACDQGQAESKDFNEFVEADKQLTYRLMRDTAGDPSTSELVLAEQAARFEFQQISFSENFEPGAGSKIVQINCLLSSPTLWNHVSGSYWDVEMPAVGVTASVPNAGMPGQTSDTRLFSTLSVERGAQLFYQEGYPAPSTRDQESDSFTESSNGYSSSGSQSWKLAEAINARYSDTVAESNSSSQVFFAGVLAGLFASFIGAALLSVVDEMFKFRVLAQIDPHATPVQPQPPASRSQLIRARGRSFLERIRRHPTK
ncbi:MAG: hypothetical protein K0Q52_76 [Microbacterium sp.]|jgi:hypothetical protein|nr:hypothetical protein [Microbacterium sp.]